jgi:hypothetical protein
MKTIRFIKTIVVIACALYFSGSGLTGFQSVGHAQKLTIEKAIPSDVMQYSLEPAGRLRNDKSIYSAATIISLVVAIIGIVAFRRKTNS